MTGRSRTLSEANARASGVLRTAARTTSSSLRRYPAACLRLSPCTLTARRAISLTVSLKTAYASGFARTAMHAETVLEWPTFE